MNTSTRCCYMSVLVTDSYLDGVLVLHASLMETDPAHPFVLLVGDGVGQASRRMLERCGIEYQPLRATIDNPTAIARDDHWSFTYSKLDIFSREEFGKIVFLDADMIVLANLDELFLRPHMSAVNAGGMLPELSHWRHLNSGLMVLEPSLELYRDMLEKVGRIETVEKGGDQDFLHAYYPDWVEQEQLQLDHAYNIFSCHLDRYRQFGYTLSGQGRQIKVVHYIGGIKPWNMQHKKFIGPISYLKQQLKGMLGRRFPNLVRDELYDQSLRIWHATYSRLMRRISSPSVADHESNSVKFLNTRPNSCNDKLFSI